METLQEIPKQEDNPLYDIAKYSAYFCNRDEDQDLDVFSGKPSHISVKPIKEKTNSICIEFRCKYYVKKNGKISEHRNLNINSLFSKTGDTWSLSINYKSIQDVKNTKNKDIGACDSIIVKKDTIIAALNELLTVSLQPVKVVPKNK